MLGFSKEPKQIDVGELKLSVIEELRTIYDPEIPANIYDLGLIYAIHITLEGEVTIWMTLTTPACPVAQSFPQTVMNAVKRVQGVSDCTVELVWEPKWSQERMSEAAKIELDIY